MVLGIDTAARLNAEAARQIRAAGYEFAGRYLVPEMGTLANKALTRGEAEALTAAGLRLLTVWETTASRAMSGAAGGAADGARALKCARALGMPESGVIYFAVDFGAQAADMDAIEAYLRAARGQTGEYETGVYGSFDVVEEMARRGACSRFWQCFAWSAGKKSARRSVYQAKNGMYVAGAGVDVNECADMDAAGIWNYEEDNMTGEQIYNKLNEYLAGQETPDWAKAELEQAVAMGVTDGARPMQLVPRYQAAIMAKRAAERARA